MRNKDKQLCLSSKISAAEQILNPGHSKKNHVLIQLSTGQWLEDLFAIEGEYQKHYRNYLRLSRDSTNPAGRPTNEIPKEI